MADPLSIAASALAVAGAGGKLAQTLYIFIESVRKSGKQLKPVADHVKLTAVVLDNIGSLLGEKDVQALCKDSLLGTTSDALEGCKQAFDELQAFVSGILKSDGNSKAKIGTFDKLTFIPFRSRELEVLQANLERFKSALDLVLSVLNLSLSIKNNKDAAQVQQLKLEVEHLLRAKKDAEDAVHAAGRAKSQAVSDATRVPRVHPVPDVSSTSRSATLPATSRSVAGDAYLPPPGIPLPAESDYFPPPPPTSSFMVMNVRVPEHPNGSKGAVATSVARLGSHTNDGAHEHISQAVQVETERPPQSSLSDDNDREDELLQHLKRCADAVADLSTMIEEATQRWQVSKRYERQRFTPAFQATHKAMKKLWAFEVDLELSDSEDSATSNEESRRHLGERSSTSSPTHARRRSHDRTARDERLLAASAAVAGLASVAHVRSGARRHSRDRGRTRSRSAERVRSHTPDLAGDLHRASAAAAGRWERGRSRSRIRSRSRQRSRVRTGLPIAATGPGGAALAGLYEKAKACEEDQSSRGWSEAGSAEADTKRSDEGKLIDPTSPTFGNVVDMQRASDKVVVLPQHNPQDPQARAESADNAVLLALKTPSTEQSKHRFRDTVRRVLRTSSKGSHQRPMVTGESNKNSRLAQTAATYESHATCVLTPKQDDASSAHVFEMDASTAYKPPTNLPSTPRPDFRGSNSGNVSSAQDDFAVAGDVDLDIRQTGPLSQTNAGFRTIHGQHRPDGILGGYRTGKGMRRLPSGGINTLVGQGAQLEGDSANEQTAGSNQIGSQEPVYPDIYRQQPTSKRNHADLPPLRSLPSPPPARGRESFAGITQTPSNESSPDDRDYILDLAVPERSPSYTREEQPDGRIKKQHPKTFQCHLCPKGFTRAYNLHSHLRIHTGERPFVCATCAEAFARQVDRKRHELVHNGGERQGERAEEGEEPVALDSVAGREDFSAVDELLRRWTLLDV